MNAQQAIDVINREFYRVDHYLESESPELHEALQVAIKSLQSVKVKPTTLKQAKALLRPLGMTSTKRDGEFRVNRLGGGESEASYDTDIDSAIDTAKENAKFYSHSDWKPKERMKNENPS